jgi:ATP-dependent Clp protease ATP-binding subunit ClpC
MPTSRKSRSRKAPPRKEARTPPVSAPVTLLVECARRKQASLQHPSLAVHHWVAALRELFPILPRDIPWDDMKVFEIRTRLREGDAGRAFPVDAAIKAALKIARSSGREDPTIEDVALAILERAGLAPADGPSPPDAPAPAPKAASPERKSATATPTLDRFGRDLTSEARAGLLFPVVDRQQEVALAVETLCRQKKKSLLLIGASGVGKRAIVEALAHRIAKGDVPASIADLRIVEVPLTALLAGVTTIEDLDRRFAQVLHEARASGTVLFLDELRSITPAGHDAVTLSFSNLVKPEIARGLTVVLSGSEEDFLRFVELDPSIRPWAQQWFQPLRVDELSAEATLEALGAIAAHTRALVGVAVAPSVLEWLVFFASDMLKGHKFPGKAVDLFEQCVAHATSRGAQRVTLSDARAIAERAIAMPVDVETRLRRIATILGESGLLLPEDARSIIDRLSVTMRSLDLVPARPNAMIMLVGAAAAASRALAETLADAINGSADRVIAIDFGLMTEAWDMRQLLGVPGANAPASLELPLHRLLDEPWSVILADNVDASHAQVRASLTRALSEGRFIDAKGKKLHLSDAVVIVTAPSVVPAQLPSVGFGSREIEGASDTRTLTSRVFDADLVEQMDLVVSTLNRGADLVEVTRNRSLLADLTRRYKTRGLDIAWDKTIVAWMGAEAQRARTRREWENWADKNLASVLIPHLPHDAAGPLKRVVVKRHGDQLVVGQARRSDRTMVE